MLTGLEQHPLERQPARCLSLGTLRDRHPGGAEALDQIVTHPFELTEVEQPGTVAATFCPQLESAHRERGHERVGELALEPDDLGAQRPARRPLTIVGDRWGRRNRHVRTAPGLI